MNVKKVMTVTCASLCLAASVFAAEGKQIQGAKLGEWTMDAPAALQLAKSTNKINILNFTGSDWCSWCKLMDAKVFSTDEWKAYAKDNLVLTWIDFPRDKSLVPAEIAKKNKALSKQYGVQGFPTYVILDADGKQIGTLSASADATPRSFINQVKGLTIIPRLKQLLSAEDYAAYEKLLAEGKALQAEADAWEQSELAQTFHQTFASFYKRQGIVDAKIGAFAKKLDASKEATSKTVVSKINELTLDPSLKQVLSAEDYAAYEKLVAENNAIQKDVDAFESGEVVRQFRQTSSDFNKRQHAHDAKIQVLIDKAQK